MAKTLVSSLENETGLFKRRKSQATALCLLFPPARRPSYAGVHEAMLAVAAVSRERRAYKKSLALGFLLTTKLKSPPRLPSRRHTGLLVILARPGLCRPHIPGLASTILHCPQEIRILNRLACTSSTPLHMLMNKVAYTHSRCG
jgi:hypothetical protein